MNNGQFTQAFLNSVSADTKNEILLNVGIHYGISTQEVYSELVDEEAESLLDYITGPIRPAISVLVQRFKYKISHG